MSANKREGMTLVFFLCVLSLVPISVGLTRLALKLHFDQPSIALISIGGLFLVLTILTLGLED